jgi:hypothetical protein
LANSKPNPRELPVINQPLFDMWTIFFWSRPFGSGPIMWIRGAPCESDRANESSDRVKCAFAWREQGFGHVLPSRWLALKAELAFAHV